MGAQSEGKFLPHKNKYTLRYCVITRCGKIADSSHVKAMNLIILGLLFQICPNETVKYLGQTHFMSVMCYAHCLVRKKIAKALLIFAANSALETTDVTSTKENIVLFQSSF